MLYTPWQCYKDLDQGQCLYPEVVAELRCTTDLALWTSKQTAAAIGHFMAAIVVTAGHLWINLLWIKEKDKTNHSIEFALPSSSVRQCKDSTLKLNGWLGLRTS